MFDGENTKEATIGVAGTAQMPDIAVFRPILRVFVLTTAFVKATDVLFTAEAEWCAAKQSGADPEQIRPLEVRRDQALTTMQNAEQELIRFCAPGGPTAASWSERPASDIGDVPPLPGAFLRAVVETAVESDGNPFRVLSMLIDGLEERAHELDATGELEQSTLLDFWSSELTATLLSFRGDIAPRGRDENEDEREEGRSEWLTPRS